MTIRKTQQVHLESTWNRDKSFIYFADYRSEPFYVSFNKQTKPDKAIVLYKQPIPWKNLAEEHRLKLLEQQEKIKKNKLTCPVPTDMGNQELIVKSIEDPFDSSVFWTKSVKIKWDDVEFPPIPAPIWQRTCIGSVIIADDDENYPPRINAHPGYMDITSKIYKLLIKPYTR